MNQRKPYFFDRAANVTALLICAILACVYFMTFHFVAQVGYLTRDDTENYFWNFDYLVYAAKVQGRVGIIWGDLSYLLGKIGGGFTVLHTLRVLAIAVFACSLYFATKQIAKRREIAILAVLFFGAFYQNTWDYSPVANYASAFMFEGAAFLCSLGLFQRYLQEKKTWMLIASAALYFYSLACEVWVPAILGFPALIIIMNTDGESRRVLKLCLPHIVATAIYLVLYVAWRAVYPPVYDGNSVPTSFSVIATLRVLFQYTLAGVPGVLAVFGNSIGNIDLNDLHQSMGRMWFLRQAAPACWLKAVLVAAATCAILVRSSTERMSWRRAAMIILLFVGLAFSVNVLVAMTAKYQDWVINNASEIYLYTFFSFVFFVIAGSFLAISLVDTIRPRFMRVLAVAAIGLVCGGITFVVAAASDVVTQDQLASNQKWALIQKLTGTTIFKNLAEGTTINAEGMARTNRGAAVPAPGYWTTYVSTRAGRRINIEEDRNETVGRGYYLRFVQKTGEQQSFLVFAEVADLAAPRAQKFVVIDTFPFNRLEIAADNDLCGANVAGQYTVCEPDRSGAYHEVVVNQPGQIIELALPTAVDLRSLTVTNSHYAVSNP